MYDITLEISTILKTKLYFLSSLLRAGSFSRLLIHACKWFSTSVSVTSLISNKPVQNLTAFSLMKNVILKRNSTVGGGRKVQEGAQSFLQENSKAISKRKTLSLMPLQGPLNRGLGVSSPRIRGCWVVCLEGDPRQEERG